METRVEVELISEGFVVTINGVINFIECYEPHHHAIRTFCESNFNLLVLYGHEEIIIIDCATFELHFIYT